MGNSKEGKEKSRKEEGGSKEGEEPIRDVGNPIAFLVNREIAAITKDNSVSWLAFGGLADIARNFLMHNLVA